MFDILENIAFYEVNAKVQQKKVKKEKQLNEQQQKKQEVKAAAKKKRVNNNVSNTFNFSARSKSTNKRGKDQPELPFDDLMVENSPDLKKNKHDSEGDQQSDHSGMSFSEEKESKNEYNTSSSLKGSEVSRSSSFVLFDSSNLLAEEEDEDEFEDAQEGPKMLSDQEQMVQLSKVIITDCDEERIALPCMRDSRLKGSVFWQILKDLVGKDISKYSMPVIVNEPLSNL